MDVKQKKNTSWVIDSEQSHADHVPWNVLYVVRFVNLINFHIYILPTGPIKFKVSITIMSK